MTEIGSQTIVVANAPVSFGAFELTVGINPNVPDAVTLLDQVAAAGYAGVDLGPAGYLGVGETLRERLTSRGLGLAGGYLELPFHDPAVLQEAFTSLDEILSVFDAVRDLSPMPKPTLADAGSPLRRANPGRSATDRSFGLSDTEWRQFGDGFARVYEHCHERGYEPTFHNETGSYVEAPWEIERVLELTDTGLCLDTGHLVMAGGDPVTAIRDWGERINQFHLKDAHRGILESVVTHGGSADEIWKQRAFCGFGEGDMPIDTILEAITDIDYSGWLVVEQDIMPEPTDPPGWAAEEQVANRAFLRERGL